MEATAPGDSEARGLQTMKWLERSLDGAQGKVGVHLISTTGKVLQLTTTAMIERGFDINSIAPEKTTMVMASQVDPGIEIGPIVSRKGFSLVVFVLEPISDERLEVLKAFGVKIMRADSLRGMKVAMAEAKLYVACHPETLLLKPFESHLNSSYHYTVTGPEILAALGGVKPDFLVTEVHAGGTIAGAGAFLKSRYPEINLVAVESAHSPVLSGSEPGPDGVPGLGGCWIPKNFCMDSVHEIMQIQGGDAHRFTSFLAVDDGVYMAVSSGAVCLAAARLAHRPDNEGKVIVAICPNAGEKHLAVLMPSLRRDLKKDLRDGISGQLGPRSCTRIPGQQDLFHRPDVLPTPIEQPCANTSVPTRATSSPLAPRVPFLLANTGQSSCVPACPTGPRRVRPHTPTTRSAASRIAGRVAMHAGNPHTTGSATPSAPNTAPPTATAAPTARSLPRVSMTPLGPTPAPAAVATPQLPARGHGFIA